MKSSAIVLALVTAASTGVAAAERSWENPVFETAEQAIAAATAELAGPDAVSDPALRLFLETTMVTAQSRPAHVATRQVHGRFLLSYPAPFLDDEVQRQTVQRFQAAIPEEQRIVEERLARFAYPTLPGLAYLRLVDSVDAFSAVKLPSSEQMTQVGGVTYYCRYVVLPLSYVGRRGVEQLRQSAALNPNLDVAGTIRRWQSQSFANLVHTFRHELVHVHTNAALGVPRYAQRSRFPTWFHEGTATYFSGDPRAGLSPRYREYQDLFSYLVERHGVTELQRFFAAVLDGEELTTALAESYAFTSSEQLFTASSRWHGGWDLATTLFWIALVAVVIAALTSARLPVIGSLMLLIAVSLAVALTAGLAEALWGLNGPGAVLAGKLILGASAMVMGWRGLRRLKNNWRSTVE